jgi:CBS domain-containing protein
MALRRPARIPHNEPMSSTARDIVTPAPIEVWPDTTLRAVAALFEENSIGAALVRGTDGAVVGVISERDLVRAVANDADVDSDRAEDHMTFEVEFATADQTVEDLARTMLDDGIRHLPVEDDDVKVIGVLSIRDVLAALVGR